MDKRAQERVAIAKDALAWIKAGALVPTHRIYVSPESDIDLNSYNSDKPLRDVVLGKCQVCAKGALFLAKAVRYDNVLVKQFYGGASDDHDGAPLREHFDEDQLTLIERVFEGWVYEDIPEEGKGVLRWIKKYPNTKKRLIAILKNIITNDGTFRL